MFRVQAHKRVKKQISRIDQQFHSHLREMIESLAEDPFPKGSLKLEGVREEAYRLKVPPFRILYTVDSEKKEVVVHAVLHRKEAYRSLRDRVFKD